MKRKHIPALLLSLAMILALCPGISAAAAAGAAGPTLMTAPASDTVNGDIDLSDGYQVCCDGAVGEMPTYPIEGKDGTVSLADLNLTVRKGDEVVPADKYTLTITSVTYDAEDKEVLQNVTPPIGLPDNPDNRLAGAASFFVTATAKESSGYKGTTGRTEFLLHDRYSLRFHGARTSFGQEYLAQSMWSWHDYYKIPVGKVNAPTVTAIDGTALAPENYTITYYVRNTERVDFDDPDYDRKVFPEENPLPGLPEEPGAYFARIDGKDPYYRSSYVDFDITGYSENDKDLQAEGYEVLMDGESWKVYPVEGKTGALNLNDLNITVKKDGKALSPDKYTLKIQRQWWEGEEQKYETVSEPFGIADNEEDRESGFTGYQVTAVAVGGSGFKGSTESRDFYIWDRYSFNWFGATADFGQDYKGKSTWSWHNYYQIPVGKVKAPTVTAIDGTVLTPDAYQITCFERKPRDETSAPGEGYPEDKPLSGLPTEPGTYFARIDAAKPPYYGTSYVDFDVVGKPITEATFIGPSAQTYTGKAIKPKVTVKDGSVTLKSGTDYTLSYKNNTKVGSATMTVTGKGKYVGAKKLTFSIKAAAMSKVDAEPLANLIYTGKALKPEPKLTYGGKILKKGTDYTVSYKSNTEIGKATLTVTGKSCFNGTKKLPFQILPKGTSISKLTPGKKKFTVKWKKQATRTAGYEIQYTLDKKFKNGVKTVTITKNTTTSKTISKLNGKKTYYVRVRTYQKLGKQTYASPWSKVKSTMVKK